MIRSSFMRSTLVVVLAVLGAVLLAVGVALVYFPAGVIVAGVATIVSAYVIRFLEVQSENS